MNGKAFSRERFVRWGDCDPAGVIYSPRVYEYAVEVLEEFYKDIIGFSWMDFKTELCVGGPMVRSEIEHLLPLVPDKKITVVVLIKEIGSKSVTYEVDGFDDQGKQYFRVTMNTVFILEPDFKSTDIPDAIRERMLTYKNACDSGRKIHG